VKLAGSASAGPATTNRVVSVGTANLFSIEIPSPEELRQIPDGRCDVHPSFNSYTNSSHFRRRNECTVGDFGTVLPNLLRSLDADRPHDWRIVSCHVLPSCAYAADPSN
jgi:hypothetical protein